MWQSVHATRGFVRPSALRPHCCTHSHAWARCVQAEDGILEALEQEAGSLDQAQLQAAILKLAGMGPFTCTNVMTLLRRFDRVPCDSETKRHLLVRLSVHRQLASGCIRLARSSTSQRHPMQ